MPFDEAIGPEALERAIDVNGCQCRSLCKLRLGYRQVEDEVVADLRGAKSGRHLAEQVRNPRLGVAATNVDDPLR